MAVAESVSVSNFPDSGSGQRVAFDLMQKISNAEFRARGDKPAENPREYYLELYVECRKLTY
jgi:hypothetical protein